MADQRDKMQKKMKSMIEQQKKRKSSSYKGVQRRENDTSKDMGQNFQPMIINKGDISKSKDYEYGYDNRDIGEARVSDLDNGSINIYTEQNTFGGELADSVVLAAPKPILKNGRKK